MDAHDYNGDYDRDHESVEDICDQCGIVLYAAEIADGRCSRCAEDCAAGARDDAA
jgi:hypothetical protein